MSEVILEISNVLNYLLAQAGISEAELARRIDIPRATINRLVSGRTPDPRASTLNAIAQFFNVSVDQLLGNEPLFLKNDQSAVAAKRTSIPIIDIDLCTRWAEVINTLKYDTFFDWLMGDSTIEEGKFGIRVQGESMWPQFQKNAILIISPHRKVKNRDFVIAYIEKTNEVLFRQYIVENSYKFLKAINDMFPVIQLKESDEIIGVVIQTRQQLL